MAGFPESKQWLFPPGFGASCGLNPHLPPQALSAESGEYQFSDGDFPGIGDLHVENFPSAVD